MRYLIQDTSTETGTGVIGQSQVVAKYCNKLCNRKKSQMSHCDLAHHISDMTQYCSLWFIYSIYSPLVVVSQMLSCTLMHISFCSEYDGWGLQEDLQALWYQQVGTSKQGCEEV